MAPALPPLAEVMDLVPDAVCVVDEDGRYLYVNASFERLFGYRPDEVVGRRMIELVHPDDREATLRAAERVMAGHLQPHFRNRYLRKDGRTVDVQWSARWAPDNRVRIAVGHDITELRRAEMVQEALFAIAEAAHAESDLPVLLARIHEVLVGLLPVGRIHVAMLEDDGLHLRYPDWRDASAAEPELRALDDDPLVATAVREARSVLSCEGTDGRALAVPLTTGQGAIGALVLRDAGDGPAWSEADRQRLEFVASQVAAACERSRHRHLLEHMAGHDPLTGLPNRHRFRLRLETALAEARSSGDPLALLFLDLDGFKAVNDRYGHETGDRLLVLLAQRLRQALRQTDTVARLGGDEFLVLLPVCTETDAQSIAATLRNVLRQPVHLGDHVLQLEVSIGAAVFPHDGGTPETLLRHADQAMYAVKRAASDSVTSARG